MIYRKRHRGHRKEKKERVLHTRVPEVLADELKRLSETLRIPVSNIVRAALEDILDSAAAMEGTAQQDEVKDMTQRYAWLRQRVQRYSERETYESPDGKVDKSDAGQSSTSRQSDSARGESLLQGVIGFQPFKLLQQTQCSECGRTLIPGREAYLGVRYGPGPRVILGLECLPKTEQEDKHDGALEDNKESNDE